jgi:hypothetical protein
VTVALNANGRMMITGNKMNQRKNRMKTNVTMAMMVNIDLIKHIIIQVNLVENQLLILINPVRIRRDLQSYIVKSTQESKKVDLVIQISRQTLDMQDQIMSLEELH